MRLERIKIAGFKSFVDPTTVPFRSNLVGVVGPNGCGKSNVIDAVRWVMGESSAKMLRGQSMADVIFNGSTGRKPVGLAGVELVFDNSDGGAGGEYARYNQISVKRQVSRDGQSVYMLNGSRCRRRDIQDLFLGTGLGPRSYAIIEQGMISRVIEARPEDLRLFLEEAAGISKYKERRKETESRMRATRENLERLEDLREEVGKQLLHLERQADTAAKYTALKDEERRLEHELKALRWRGLDDEIAGQDRRLATLNTVHEAMIAEQRRVEADGEAKRAAYSGATDQFNEIQARFYAVGSEIARAEQSIQFANETRGRHEAELVRLDHELSEAQHHLERDAERLQELETALTTDEPLLTQAESELAEAAGTVATAEERHRLWESEWDGFNQQAAHTAEQAQLERAKINHLEQSIGRDRERQRRIEDELSRLDPGETEARIEAIEARDAQTREQLESLESDRAAVGDELAGLDTRSREISATLDAVRTELQQAKGRQASLAALQEDALADNDSDRGAWLAAHGLDSVPRLAERISVERGWERAVESVLDDALRAVPATGVVRLVGDDLPAGVVLLDAESPPATAQGDGPPGLARLSSKIDAPWPLDGLVGPVWVVDDEAEAVVRRPGLGVHESLITPTGIRVGRDWVRGQPAHSGDGVLARAEALKALDGEIASATDRIQALEDEAECQRLVQTRLTERRAAREAEISGLNRELSAMRAELTGLAARREHIQERAGALQSEREELEAGQRESLEEMEEARERLHALLEDSERLAEQRDALSAERESLRERVAAGRELERICRARVQNLRVGVESNRAALAATSRSLERLQEQLGQLQGRRDELIEAIEDSVEPLAQQREQLDEQLVIRVEVEESLAEARDRLEVLDADLRVLEQERQSAESQAHELQRQLDALRLERQERIVRRRTLEEQLAESQHTPSAIIRTMDPAAEEGAWAERLTKIGARIQRLGAINLAAIDEFEEQKRRKGYLDEQYDDITRALETLEQAIRKIDRETRGRFKDTYDQVAHGFQQIFPRLFGGGHAYLELTGEDLLETGVSVMARPPGKRNASIHLLSGGEKALTAVALVFAIFQLNPAPFCMLDEVDAPLDDANVGRFCQMVRSMSDQVQFIFISHNKVTMEIADHLLGVTMHEPGVSRLVSVDVDEAVRLAVVS